MSCKIDPAVKAAWVAALRSGKYEQGRHALRKKGDTFCCLGVLCDVVDPDGWGSHPDATWYVHRGHWNGPGPMALTMIRPEGHLRAAIESLVGMNDIDELPFPEIAAWIEENL